MMQECKSPSVLGQLVERASSLYSPPSIAMQVLELTALPKINTRALKDCIENDPALVGKILRVVNSSMFGLSGKVSDLNQALALLGIKPLKLLVLGFSLPPQLFAGLDPYMLDRYWRRTLTRAVAARLIAETLWNRSGDDAFVAGLLQDMGMVVMLQEWGTTYRQFVQRVEQEGKSLAEAEIASLGFDHAILSAKIMQKWNFPEELAEVVGAAHALEEIDRLPTNAKSLGHILHLADLFAAFLSGNHDHQLQTILTRGDQFAGMTPLHLESILDRIQDRVSVLAEIYALHLDDVELAESILRRANQQMSALAESAAVEMLEAEEMVFDESRQLAATVRRFQISMNESDASPREDKPLPEKKKNKEDRSKLSHEATLPDKEAIFLKSVATAVAESRELRAPLSLLAVGIDQYGDSQNGLWSNLSAAEVENIFTLVSHIAPAGSLISPLAEGTMAILLFQHDREDAIDIARDMLEAIRNLLPADPPNAKKEDSPTLSIGIASLAQIPKNDPSEDFVDTAKRCLYAAQSAGGDNIKSLSL